MIYRRMPPLLRVLPEALRRHVLDFEWRIEESARAFASSLAPGSRVLDAGAGEAQYAPLFCDHRYLAIDLAIGDASWSYRSLDAVCDLSRLPFTDNTFDGCLNLVTLEHVAHPAAVLAELRRVLRPGGRLLLVTPLEWEEHQEPHDYYRYTRYGLQHLLRSAGLEIDSLEPAGGFFRLLARRLLNAGQFFPRPLALLLMIAAAPLAILLPLFDAIDHRRHFTLGYVCTARKPSSSV